MKAATSGRDPSGSNTRASRLPTVNQVVPLHLGKVAPTFWVQSLTLC